MEALVQAVILAGGMGTRLREETEFKPKPMVEIGGRPLLWHLMKNLSTQGINDFIICLGYKGDQIKDYFLNYNYRNCDFEINLNGTNNTFSPKGELLNETWNVILADTGLETMTGGRISRVRKYIRKGPFLCTYGDGLSDVDIQKLQEFHKSHGLIATVTAVQPTNRFGALKINEKNLVTEFSEKPKNEKWVNGGFFIFENRIFDYLDDDCILEKEPLEKLSLEGKLKAFKHTGFWQPMDTYRESIELNSLWGNKEAPWKNW